jgi:ribosome-binding factor A
MKHLPNLTFTEDPAVTEGKRVDEIIRRLHDGEEREDEDRNEDE